MRGALAHNLRRSALFDPASVPVSVRDRLAVIGFWVCPPDLRNRVGHWDELDEQDVPVAENDLDLMISVVAR